MINSHPYIQFYEILHLRPQILAETPLALHIALLCLPPLPSLISSKISTIPEGLMGACSPILGFELEGLLLGPAALSARPGTCGSCDHPTRLET